MGIISGPKALTGEIGVKPVLKRMTTTDDLAAISVAGYLNTNLNDGEALRPSDLLLVIYNYNQQDDTGDKGFFTVGISNGIITLTSDVSEGNVVLPVTTDNMAIYSDTTGKIKDGPALASTTGYGQVSLVASDPSSNLIFVEVGFGTIQLAASGQVEAYTATTGAQYRVREIFLIYTGSGEFTGGGGDRDIILTDGTTTFTTLTAAVLAAPANARWGATELPYPPEVEGGLNANTIVGASLIVEYSGGTIDYTAGSLGMSILLQRVT